ncbi:hypothetical protein N9A49_04505 [Salibacteraceae bacterium]|jgi:hypothetical protein|nr:hypothetical protein [Salibacteraceae bacterium]MDB0002555.1 hypothetical protein [Salibacteraceae bacterium]MDB4104270.1 hypothetical protein [Salibacteraceae bacterium]HAQ69881.1 hypothetical protein [Flavobacteriales bacterium]
MLKRSQDNVTLKLKQTERFLLYRVSGSAARPLRFDLINLDGKKVRSIDLLYGNEFVIPVLGLEKGEYLYAFNSIKGLLQTGVITL